MYINTNPHQAIFSDSGPISFASEIPSRIKGAVAVQLRFQNVSDAEKARKTFDGQIADGRKLEVAVLSGGLLANALGGAAPQSNGPDLLPETPSGGAGMSVYRIRGLQHALTAISLQAVGLTVERPTSPGHDSAEDCRCSKTTRALIPTNHSRAIIVNRACFSSRLTSGVLYRISIAHDLDLWLLNVLPRIQSQYFLASCIMPIASG